MDTLEKFGYKFQTKILTSLITDRDFLIGAIDLMDVQYFNSESLKFLASSTLEYFREYRLTPTLEVFKVKIASIEREALKSEVVSTLKDVWGNIGSTDLDYIKDEAFKFYRQQAIRVAFEQSLEDFKNGDYDEIVRKLDAANRKGLLGNKFGLDYLVDVDYRYTDQAETERIKTGWEVLDTLTGGGIPKRKLAVVMAPTGIGKSWVLAHLGAAALKAGKTVLHYTLELDDIYTAKRYDTIITGIPFDKLSENQAIIKRALSKYEGKLFIEEHPTSTLSLVGLEANIEKYILAGFQPDLVILDYAELMKINFNSHTRDDKTLGQLYTDLRGLAGRKDFVLWTADQTNREGASKDVIGTDSISNAFSKMFVADFMMSLSRKPQDKINDTARIHVAKSRLGMDGITYPCMFDTERGKIELYDERTESGKKQKGKMLPDEDYEKQYGAKHLERFKNMSSQKSYENDF